MLNRFAMDGSTGDDSEWDLEPSISGNNLFHHVAFFYYMSNAKPPVIRPICMQLAVVWIVTCQDIPTDWKQPSQIAGRHGVGHYMATIRGGSSTM